MAMRAWLDLDIIQKCKIYNNKNERKYAPLNAAMAAGIIMGAYELNISGGYDIMKNTKIWIWLQLALVRQILGHGVYKSV